MRLSTNIKHPLRQNGLRPVPASRSFDSLSSLRGRQVRVRPISTIDLIGMGVEMGGIQAGSHLTGAGLESGNVKKVVGGLTTAVGSLCLGLLLTSPQDVKETQNSK